VASPPPADFVRPRNPDRPGRFERQCLPAGSPCRFALHEGKRSNVRFSHFYPSSSASGASHQPSRRRHTSDPARRVADGSRPGTRNAGHAPAFDCDIRRAADNAGTRQPAVPAPAGKQRPAQWFSAAWRDAGATARGVRQVQHACRAGRADHTGARQPGCHQHPGQPCGGRAIRRLGDTGRAAGAPADGTGSRQQRCRPGAADDPGARQATRAQPVADRAGRDLGLRHGRVPPADSRRHPSSSQETAGRGKAASRQTE
jgi:hypothetical protein